MLHPDNAEIVKATAPVVIEHITEITKVFYPKMFANNPELLNVFNQANQAIGEQPVALASSIVAYAHHLLGDADFDFDAVIDRIANKHVALAIAPADYTVVGRNLLDAIADVLGDAVTPEVARAWGEVYWLFAVDLISAEAKIYQQIERTPDTMLSDYEIVEIRDAGADARTFRLAPLDGSRPPAHVGTVRVGGRPTARRLPSAAPVHDQQRARREHHRHHRPSGDRRGRRAGRRGLDLPVRPVGRRRREGECAGR